MKNIINTITKKEQKMSIFSLKHKDIVRMLEHKSNQYPYCEGKYYAMDDVTGEGFTDAVDVTYKKRDVKSLMILNNQHPSQELFIIKNTKGEAAAARHKQQMLDRATARVILDEVTLRLTAAGSYKAARRALIKNGFSYDSALESYNKSYGLIDVTVADVIYGSELQRGKVSIRARVQVAGEVMSRGVVLKLDGRSSVSI